MSRNNLFRRHRADRLHDERIFGILTSLLWDLFYCGISKEKAGKMRENFYGD